MRTASVVIFVLCGAGLVGCGPSADGTNRVSSEDRAAAARAEWQRRAHKAPSRVKDFYESASRLTATSGGSREDLATTAAALKQLAELRAPYAHEPVLTAAAEKVIGSRAIPQVGDAARTGTDVSSLGPRLREAGAAYEASGDPLTAEVARNTADVADASAHGAGAARAVADQASRQVAGAVVEQGRRCPLPDPVSPIGRDLNQAARKVDQIVEQLATCQDKEKCPALVAQAAEAAVEANRKLLEAVGKENWQQLADDVLVPAVNIARSVCNLVHTLDNLDRLGSDGANILAVSKDLIEIMTGLQAFATAAVAEVKGPILLALSLLAELLDLHFGGDGNGHHDGDKSKDDHRQTDPAQKPASGKDGGSGGDPKPQPLTEEQKQQVKEQAPSVAAALTGGRPGAKSEKLREAAVDETIRQLKISDAQARGAMLRWLGQSGTAPAHAEQAAAEAVFAAHTLGFVTQQKQGSN